MARTFFITLLFITNVLAGRCGAQGLVQKFSKDTTGLKSMSPSGTIPAVASPAGSATVPINFATCNYGIFCRTEVKLDKVTPIKVRFRLGSAQQTDWLEGKAGAQRP